jgi:hypothetical protein
MYYHKSCYENWKKNMQDPKADMTPKQWYDSAREFLAKDVRMDVDWEKFASQWKTFLRPSYRPEMTPKGIYFAIKYYFDVKHGDKAKAQGGIGLFRMCMLRVASTGRYKSADCGNYCEDY